MYKVFCTIYKLLQKNYCILHFCTKQIFHRKHFVHFEKCTKNVIHIPKFRKLVLHNYASIYFRLYYVLFLKMLIKKKKQHKIIYNTNNKLMAIQIQFKNYKKKIYFGNISTKGEKNNTFFNKLKNFKNDLFQKFNKLMVRTKNAVIHCFYFLRLLIK